MKTGKVKFDQGMWSVPVLEGEGQPIIFSSNSKGQVQDFVDWIENGGHFEPAKLPVHESRPLSVA